MRFLLGLLIGGVAGYVMTSAFIQRQEQFSREQNASLRQASPTSDQT